MAVFLRPPHMLEWITERIGTAVTPEQAQAAFDGLVRRGALRPWLDGLWELETSDPELLRWLLGLDVGGAQPQEKSSSP
ncbi:hypothetical protein [Synechococcus sp. HJ21-Hayes]|uniref:hypothetical protein n=1 Tax=Synechococcus sp. HJ21-Hayes TaxID=2823736 RepID=UPI0020CCD7C4|nr:hypothetical protein [Synechococcus sp. HJ21-Hayes]